MKKDSDKAIQLIPENPHADLESSGMRLPLRSYVSMRTRKMDWDKSQ
jgi:hypothetical protein